MRPSGDQRGFTLIELLVGSAVSVMLLSVLVALTFQTTRVTTDSSAQISTLEDIRNVALPVTPDVRMAQETSLVDGADPVDSVTLDWTSWYDNDGELTSVDYHCEYTFLEGQGKLERKYWEYYDEGSPGTPTSTRTFGNYATGIEFSRDANLVTVTITSSSSGTAETERQLTYQASMHPTAEVPLY